MKAIANLKNTDKSSRLKSIGVIVVGLFLIIMLLINDYNDKSMGFTLSQDDSDNGITEYSPHLTLPAGEYDVNFTASGISSGTITVESGDGNVVYEATSNSGTMTLDKDYSELIVKTSGNARVTNLTVTSTGGAIFSDKYFLALVFLIALLWLVYIKFIKRATDTDTAINIFLVCLGVFTSYMFFSDYLQTGHDLPFHLYRIEGIKDGLVCGQFPVRVQATALNGYGYGAGLYYPDIFLYFPAILRLCGVSLVTAYKSLWVAVNIVTAFAAYHSAKRITGSRYAGLWCALLYTTCTWRIVNFTMRAAVGEALAMAFLPIVICGLYEILYGDKSKWWIFALGCTCVFQSHIISTVICAMFIVVMIAASLKRLISEKRYIPLLKAAALIIVINLWFLIPFVTAYFGIELDDKFDLSQKAYIQRGAIIPAELFNILNNKMGISQILSEGMRQDMSLSLGIGASLAFVICAAHFMIGKPQNKLKGSSYHAKAFVFAVVALFATTSLFPWDYLRDKFDIINALEATLQFPWRFLSIVCAISCVSAACILVCYKAGRSKTVLAGAAVLCALSVVLVGTTYTFDNDVYLKKGVVSHNSDDFANYTEYLPAGTNYSSLEAGEYNTSSSSISVEDYTKNGTTIDVTVSGARDGSWVEVPLLYYLGYSAKDQNGNKLEVTGGDNEVVRVYLESGTSEFTVKYTGLAVFRVGDIISLIALILVLCYAYFKRYRNIDIAKVCLGRLLSKNERGE